MPTSRWNAGRVASTIVFLLALGTLDYDSEPRSRRMLRITESGLFCSAADVYIDPLDGPYASMPFTLAHNPVGVAGSYVLAGHLHPCSTLVGAGRQRERLPCFWFSPSVGVLPAFGDFTGCAEVTAGGDDTVWVIAGEQVLQVTRHES